jgi:CTP synthase
VAASIGKCLQVRGLRVTALKIDPYLNYDSGLMNPYVHGEVFVTEDGGETDLDLGRYERFLNTTIGKRSNITTGQVYLEVIQRERRGDYLGKCVQIIPQVTDEIKHRIGEATKLAEADVGIVEVGGTVGDIEGMPFLEAVRQMRLELGEGNTVIAHVALVPFLETVSEYKTKPLQHSVQELRRIGLQPDLIFVRSKGVPPEDVMQKVALFSSVERRHAFAAVNLESIYALPEYLDGQGLGDVVCDELRLKCPKPSWDAWSRSIEGILKPKDEVKIALIGKYVSVPDSYISVMDALHHAGGKLGIKVDVRMIEAEELEKNETTTSFLGDAGGILVPGGFGSRGAEGKMSAMKYAREHLVPFLGLCFGFQLSAVEFARNMLGMNGANSTEVDPDTPYPIVHISKEQLKVDQMGGTQRLGVSKVNLRPGSLAHKIYGKKEVFERHRHRYEINGDYIGKLSESGLEIVGNSDDGRAEILALSGHPFFLATQFHPEFKSWPGSPNPCFYGFVSASYRKKKGEPVKPDLADFNYPSRKPWP